MLPWIGRPPAGGPRGEISAWARGSDVVRGRRAQLVANMHARANSRWRNAVNACGRVGEGQWREHQSEVAEARAARLLLGYGANSACVGGRRGVQEQRRVHHVPRLSASLAEIEHQHETKRWGVGLRHT